MMWIIARIALHADSAGTDATAVVSIILDGNILGKLKDVLDGNSIDEVFVNIGLSEIQSYFSFHGKHSSMSTTK